jgi:hypothetical protein
VAHGDFFVISKGDLVGPCEFSKSQETGEAGVEKGIKEKVVVKGGGGEVIGDGEKVCDGEGGFALSGGAVISFGSRQCSIDEGRFAVEAYVGEEWFELVANTGKVGVHGFKVDVEALEGCVVA